MNNYDYPIQVNNYMLIEELIDEYRMTKSYDPMGHIDTGNRFKSQFKIVNTPLTDFEVRYKKDNKYHDYFLYNKQSGRCVGLFTIEETNIKLKVIKRGIRVVTPHMALAPEAQRQGISTLAYTTFLQGGPWVFVTDEHTKAASKLWDSIATGNIISFYVSEIDGKPTNNPGFHDLRVLGPKDRFIETNV